MPHEPPSRRAPLSRRRFLKLGLFSGAALAGGSWLFMQRWDPRYRRLAPEGYRPVVLSTKEMAVLQAFCERVIAPSGGAPSVREARIAERIDRELAFHQAKLRSDFGSALFLVEHGGWLHAAPTRFTRLAADAQDAYLERMASGGALERQAFGGLRLMALYFYYCDERTWPTIGYEGPLVSIAAPPEADSRVAPRKSDG